MERVNNQELRSIRYMVEKAYLYCWGNNGTADERDIFKTVLQNLRMAFDIGNFTYSDSRFHWTNGEHK